MYKCKLQELCQKSSLNLPEYDVVRDGSDHDPRFTATVTVNGQAFETRKNQCRTSKEAQNLAAQLAFESITASGDVPQRPTLKYPHLSRSVTSPSSSAHLPDVFHTYKNRLQHYTQKHGLKLPAYSYEYDGPPHLRRFKAKVTICEKTYETSDFFPTLKDAEYAAAKIAYESLSPNDIEEDDSIYKSLLQQTAQKKGFIFPTYVTNDSGPPHSPTFISTVTVGTETFQGPEAKTKKQAEIRAAKVAYETLTEGTSRRNSPSGYHMKGVLGLQSSDLQQLQPAKNNQPQENANVVQSAHTEEAASDIMLSNLKPAQHIIDNHLAGEDSNVRFANVDYRVLFGENNLKEATKLPSSIVRSVDLCQGSQPKDFLIPKQKPDAEIKDAKRSRCSSSLEGLNGHTREFEDQKPSGVGAVASSKIIVYPLKSNMQVPEGAIKLSFEDDKYVAFELDQSQ